MFMLYCCPDLQRSVSSFLVKKRSVGNLGSGQGEGSHGEERQSQVSSLIYKKCIPESRNKVFSFPQFLEM